MPHYEVTNTEKISLTQKYKVLVNTNCLRLNGNLMQPYLGYTFSVGEIVIGAIWRITRANGTKVEYFKLENQNIYSIAYNFQQITSSIGRSRKRKYSNFNKGDMKTYEVTKAFTATGINFKDAVKLKVGQIVDIDEQTGYIALRNRYYKPVMTSLAEVSVAPKETVIDEKTGEVVEEKKILGMKKGLGITVIVVGALALVGGGYFLYTKFA